MVSYPCWRCVFQTILLQQVAVSLSLSAFQSLPSLRKSCWCKWWSCLPSWKPPIMVNVSSCITNFLIFFFSLSSPLWCFSQFWPYAADPRATALGPWGLWASSSFSASLCKSAGCAQAACHAFCGCLPLLRISAFYFLTPVWKKHVLIQQNHPYSS